MYFSQKNLPLYFKQTISLNPYQEPTLLLFAGTIMAVNIKPHQVHDVKGEDPVSIIVNEFFSDEEFHVSQ